MEYIKIITSKEMIRVRPEDIVFLEADGNYTDIVLYTGQRKNVVLKLIDFEKYFAQLQNNPFLRVGKSLIVNRTFVFHVDTSTQRLVLAGCGLDKQFQQHASKEALAALIQSLKEEGGQK